MFRTTRLEEMAATDYHVEVIDTNGKINMTYPTLAEAMRASNAIIEDWESRGEIIRTSWSVIHVVGGRVEGVLNLVPRISPETAAFHDLVQRLRAPRQRIPA